MATILNITYDQSFNVPLERKSKFGEVKTDYKLIEKMFNLIPKKLFNNPNLKWCDPCSGSGEFMIYLFKILSHELHKNVSWSSQSVAIHDALYGYWLFHSIEAQLSELDGGCESVHGYCCLSLP